MGLKHLDNLLWETVQNPSAGFSPRLPSWIESSTNEIVIGAHERLVIWVLKRQLVKIGDNKELETCRNSFVADIRQKRVMKNKGFQAVASFPEEGTVVHDI